jgi:hypothetical protein
VLTVSGRHLYDTCGKELVVRGIEEVLGFGFEVNGSLPNVVDEIAKTGANAVRILPDITQLSTSDVDAVVGRAVQNGLVVYISPGDRTWFGRSEVKTLVDKYEPYILLDAFQEPDYDDAARWESDAKAAVELVRSYGYRVPLVTITNQGGRDVVAALHQGANVVAADPLGNTIIGWQAYWGSSNWYQQKYGMSLQEAMKQIDGAPFAIQMGLDDVTDQVNGVETLDYGSLMNDAKSYGIGWLWWDWRLIGDDRTNDLSKDGTYANLSSLGSDVVSGQAAGIAKSSVKACRPPGF